jgi:sodium-dependent dicarboxylate transporter 2/3/5
MTDDYSNQDDESNIESLEGSVTGESSKSTIILTESKEELILDPVIVVVDTSTSRQEAAEKERKRKIRVGTMMSVAYASNIGGTGSQIGSGPQLALKGILQKSVSQYSIHHIIR